MSKQIDEEYLTLKARIQALRSSSSMDKEAQKTILEQINRERMKRLIIDKKLYEQEKEYQEIVKAQEIMDQIDDDRK